MDSTKIICEIDGKEFRDEKSVYHHRKRHHSSKMRDKKCNKCDKTFFTQRDLTTHEVKDQHSTESFHCVQCEKIYSKQANLKAHIKAAHEQKTIDCQICKKSFTSQHRKMNIMKGARKKKRQSKKIFCHDQKSFKQNENQQRKL